MIVCMGDSISAGQHLEPGELAWPWLLEAVPAGVPGDTTRLGLERFPRDVQARDPGIVVIQFGHNDANRWQTDRGLPRVSLKAYAANLEEMVHRCRVFGALPYLCTLTPSTRSEQHAEDCADYDHALRQVASALRVPVVDVRAAFGDGEGLLLDGLHLNEDGHRLYAETVRAAL